MDATLHDRIAALEAQVSALANANALAAELMAELEDASAIEASLRRRTEELDVQRSIDCLLVDSLDLAGLALALLHTLTQTPALELENEALLALLEGDTLREYAAMGTAHDPRHDLEACRQILVGEAPGEWSEDGRVRVVLRAGSLRLGVLCLRCRPGTAWRDRWLGLLVSFGAQIGVAIKRLQSEAHNERLVIELERTNTALHEQLDTIVRQQAQIRRLSAPILRVSRGALVVPIVGAIDDAQILDLRERLLQALCDKRARIAILDLTGLDIADVTTGQRLHAIIGAVRLLGARCRITGLRPELAMTLAGHDVRGLESYATLADALADRQPNRSGPH
jgi:rsbT co-antagonist protein RsbR